MAYGTQNVSALGTGVSDIFAGFGDLAKAQGYGLEQQSYELASQYALQEEQYTKMSTDIQQAQQARKISGVLGGIGSEVAGAGFAASGSALDILRSSASQGALEHAVIGEQGLITEQGFAEQAQAFNLQAEAAGKAASSANLAAIGSFVGAGLSFAGAAIPG